MLILSSPITVIPRSFNQFFTIPISSTNTFIIFTTITSTYPPYTYFVSIYISINYFFFYSETLALKRIQEIFYNANSTFIFVCPLNQWLNHTSVFTIDTTLFLFQVFDFFSLCSGKARMQSFFYFIHLLWNALHLILLFISHVSDFSLT